MPAPPCSRRRSRLRALAALATLVAAPLGAPAAATTTAAEAPAPQRMRLGYSIYLGGIDVLDASIRLDLKRAGYAMEVAAKTEGLAATLAPWQFQAVSEGAAPDGLDVRPGHYKVTSKWGRKTRLTTLDYDGKGGVTARIVPPHGQDDRDPVPEALQRDTVDLLSGTVSMLKAVAEGKGCSRTVPVFDGRQRYDLIVEQRGERRLEPSKYALYAGPALVCEVTVKPIAGQSKKRGRFWSNDGDAKRPPIQVWVAPVTAGGPPLPVRIVGETLLGDLVAHLTSAVPEPRTASTEGSGPVPPR